MRTLSKHLKHHLFRRNQTGQAIILLALAMIGLLAFVGLVTDISLLFVRYSQLRRAVDAASIAAAGQVRENRDYADLALAARQFIRLHGLDPDRVLVQTCVTNPGDPELCTVPPRKLVRVQAQVDSPTTFLRLVGWQSVTLETSAVSETAALDVALVLDTSESMAQNTNLASYTSVAPSIPRSGCDGSTTLGYYECCNDPGNGQVGLDGTITNLTSSAPDYDYSDLVCAPFKDVKDAAREFVQRLDFVRGDRVVFVTFDRNALPIEPDNPSGPGFLPPLITDEGVAVETLNKKVGVGMNHDVDMGEADRCWTFPTGVAMWTYEWLAPCPDTNIGGGLFAAQNVLTRPEYIRRTAVWVIILLSDGAANVTPMISNSAHEAVPDDFGTYGRWGYCPWWTFCNPALADKDPQCTEYDPLVGASASPFCSDADPRSRHFCMTADGTIAYDATGCDITRYDATDYAMDMADFAGLVEVRDNVAGNFIAMYSIGFGVPIENATARLGEATLRYIADAGDNGRIDNDYQEDCRDNGLCGDWADPTTQFAPPDPCQNATFHEDCGQYWYADNADDLERVFSEIASRLFTRLSR